MIGDKQRKESKRNDQSSSEEQALGSFSDDVDRLRDENVVHQVDTKEDMSVVLVGTHIGKAYEKGHIPNVNCQNDSQEPDVNASTSSIADLMIQETGENESSSTNGHDLQGDDMNMSNFSHLEHAGRDESNENLSPPGPVNFDGTKVAEGDFHQDVQLGIQLANETCPSDAQIDALEGHTVPSEVLEECVASEHTDKGQIKQLSEEDLLHVGVPEIIVSSPVPTDDESSYEGSVGKGDVNEVQVEVEQHSSENDSQFVDDLSWKSQTFKHEDMEFCKTAGDLSPVQTETNQENDISGASKGNNFEASSGKSSEGATVAQPNCSAVQGSVPNLGERASNLLSQLRSEIASMKSARLSSAVPIIGSEDDANEPEVENNQSHAEHETNSAAASLTSQEHDLSNLESQDHDTFQVTPKEIDTSEQAYLQEHCTSDQASKKRDVPQPSPQELGIFQAEPVSQECNTIETVPQGCDPSQPQPVSTVVYGLPLFEDVDSTCTSFSLDDYDPNIEEALNLPSESADRFDDNKGENKGTI